MELAGFGTWEKVAEDRVLQGSSGSHSAGEELEAGLPEISGMIGYESDPFCNQKFTTGAFIPFDTPTYSVTVKNSSTTGDVRRSATFSAAKSNSLYGKSDTVQPAAYVVNIWRRVS